MAVSVVSQKNVSVRGVDIQKVNVLLIEDNPDDADYIREILALDLQCVFRVEWVDRLAKGLERMGQNGFDVVLLDLSLPDSSGLDTVVRFRVHAPKAPVVVLTGLNDEKTGMESIQKGVQDYLVKSDNLRDLLPRAIRYAVERAKTQAAQKELEKLKEDFISILSHEIRTPLTVIKGALDNLIEAPDDPLSPRQSEFVGMAGRNAARLNAIIQNVLTLSRMESGKAILNRGRVLLGPILAEGVRAFMDEAGKKKLEILLEAPENLPPVYADSDMFLEVMYNLLGNALRFARTKVWVRAKLLEGGPGMRISVIDDGPGIPADQIGGLFDKYVQVKQIKKPRGEYKGTGLGLAICKQIVELHQGSVRAENVPGLGAGFQVILPVYDQTAAFEFSGRQAIEEADRRKAPLTMIVIDVRNMEGQKPRVGEKGPEELLRTIEDRISLTLRREDVRLRLDERVVLLVHADLEKAEELCRRIEAVAGGNPPVSFTFGMAAYPADGRTPRELFDKSIRNTFGGNAA